MNETSCYNKKMEINVEVINSPTYGNDNYRVPYDFLSKSRRKVSMSEESDIKVV